MFDQIEIWPAQDYNRLETPGLEPPEPSDPRDEENYDYPDDDDFDFEMPTDDGVPE